MRNVDEKLVYKLKEIEIHPIDIYFWELFYEFIIMSYKFPENKRYGISELFFELKNNDIPIAGELIKVYAHGMYLLAKFDDKKIYGRDFNV